jgi:dolichyl-phosphate beta-glucosyltransferase
MTYLSVIIPAYNEEKRLPKAIKETALYLMMQDYRSEILVVENGSTDRTAEVANYYLDLFTSKGTNLRGRLIRSLKGKGAAVQAGMLCAQGTWLYMADVDFSTPIEFVRRFLPPEFEGEIGIGSREAPGGKRFNEPARRHLTGRIFNSMTSLILPEIKDTQCGFKMFRRDAARDLFKRLTVTGWAFDVEVLYLAAQRGYEIKEIGVPWYYNGDSRVRVIRDSLRMAKDISKIWLQHESGENEPEKDYVSP